MALPSELNPHPALVLIIRVAKRGGLPPSVETAVRNAIVTIEVGGFDQYREAAYPEYVAAARTEDPILTGSFVNMTNAVGQDAGLRQMRALLAVAAPLTDFNEIR